MARHVEPEEGSLDLLLDTVCNTFGGVLFISMLVVILLNVTTEDVFYEPPDAEARKRLSDLVFALEESELEAKRIGTILSSQRTLAHQIDPTAQSAAIKDLVEAQTELNKIQSENKELLHQIGSGQVQINDVAAVSTKIHDEFMEVQRIGDGIEGVLHKEIIARTRKAKLPKERDTKKNEIALLVAGGRLHTVVKLGRGSAQELNREEVEEIQDGSGVSRIRPKAGAGIALSAGGGDGIIAKRMAAFDKDRHYMAIAVWPDSYEYFDAVRSALVAMNFEYRLVPLTDDKGVPMGQATSVSPRVQ